MGKRKCFFSVSMTLLIIISGMTFLITIPEDIFPISFTKDATGSFYGGNGTSSNPYQISNITQLQDMNNDLSAHYILINDINASDTINWNGGKGFLPIGDYSNKFNGSLYGMGYNISGLFINRSSNSYIGLFGSITIGAVIGNVSLIDCYISGGSLIGGLIGRNYGTVSNCSVAGRIVGAGNSGGLIGKNEHGNVSFCSTTVWLSGTHNGYQNNYGGLIGHNGGSVSNCFASGNISSPWRVVGGLIGSNEGIISNCYATGNVFGTNIVGGLVGSNGNRMISNCYSTGIVSSSGNKGGLIGDNNIGIIANCFWDIQTSNISYSDGGVGKNTSEMNIKITFTSADWDFSITWKIIDGDSYPFLQSFDYNGVLKIITENVKSSFEEILYYVDYDTNSPLPGGGTNWNFNTNASAWLTMKKNGVLSGTPLQKDIGTFWVNISASLNEEDFVFTNFTLTVYNINDPPRIVVDPFNHAWEDQLYWVEFVAFDEDPTMDVFTWSLETNTSFLDLNPMSGNLSGTPSNSDDGSYWIHITVTDGNGGFDRINFTLQVHNVNDDPEITTLYLPDAIEDAYYSYTLQGKDIDPTEDILTWEIMDTNAQFLRIDSSSGNLSGIPTNIDVGIRYVNVSIFDGKGGFSWNIFILEVLNMNNNPEITTLYLPDAIEDAYYSFTLQGKDIDPTEDILTWEILETNTDFLSVDFYTGNVTGIPKNDDVGTWYVNVSVSDGNDGFDMRNYTLTVLNKNHGPTLKKTELILTIEEDSKGVTFDLNDAFFDIDSDPLSFHHGGSNHLFILIDENIVTIIPYPNWCGMEIIPFTASDKEFSVGINISVIVTPVNDAPYGALIITESNYIEGRDQMAKCTAFDVDIPYNDELTFRWVSNISGEIGFGQFINLSLPEGIHLITVTVVDIVGSNTTTSKEIEIIAEDTEVIPDDNEVKEENDSLIIFVIFILILLFSIIFLFVINRQKQTNDNYEE